MKNLSDLRDTRQHVASKKLPFSVTKSFRASPKNSDGGDKSQMVVEMWPLFSYARMLLIIPVSLDSSGRFSFRWLSWTTLLSAACWAVLMTSTTYLFMNQQSELLKAAEMKRPLSDLVEIASGLLLLFYVPLIPVAVWQETGQLCSLVNAWSDLEEEYRSLTGGRLRLGLRRVSWTVILISLSSGILINTLCTLKAVGIPFWTWLPFQHFCMFTMCSSGLWFGICWAVRSEASALAFRMTLDVRQRGALRANRLLWLRLNGILHMLCVGCVRTQQIVFVLLFVEWVVGNFGLMNIILIGAFNNWHNIVFHVITSFSCGLSLYVLCNSSQLAVDGLKNFARDILLEMPLKTLNEDVMYEVDVFLDTIQHNSKDSLSIGGYVKCNRAILVTFLKTTGTYLVVLSQFATAYIEASII